MLSRAERKIDVVVKSRESKSRYLGGRDLSLVNERGESERLVMVNEPFATWVALFDLLVVVSHQCRVSV